MEDASREQGFQELKEMLLAREYTPGILNAAIAKARAIPRLQALRRVPRQDTPSRPAFVILGFLQYPRLQANIGGQW